MENNKRILYLDIARIFAMFSVVILHVASTGWYASDIYSGEWAVYNFYYGMTRWGVPVFLMISGALFLDERKEITKKALFGKYIKRLIIAYLFWSVLYACKDAIVLDNVSAGSFVKTVVEGHYHMWYIPMLIGIYLLIPVFKQLAKDESVMKYLLILLIVFCFGVRTMGMIPALYEVYHIFDRILFSAFSGYAAYFLLGYYLNKIELKKYVRYLCYLLGLLGTAATILITMNSSRAQGAMYIDFNDGFSVNVVCISVSVFVFVKYAFAGRNIKSFISSVIVKISDSMFGVYMVHVLVLELLELWGISVLNYQAWWAVPAIALVVWLVSFVIVTAIRRIPVLKKYIV